MPSISIKKAIDMIDRNEILLPAIQREFVWESQQIEKLFDSLMRNYPISTFLFWNVQRNNAEIQALSFYKFLDNYDERNPHNDIINLENLPNNSFTALLDGQQRMTSLYIALKGSYTKRRRPTRANPEEYPQKFLYLNLYKTFSEEDAYEESSGKIYDFRFLTEEEALIKNNEVDNEVDNNLPVNFFIKCNDFLSRPIMGDMMMFLQNENVFNRNVNKQAIAMSLFNDFYNRIHNLDNIISYYEVTSNSLNEVLDIFIRVNSGGKVLTPSDLFLSVATAQWGVGTNAREEIIKLVDELNSIGVIETNSALGLLKRINPTLAKNINPNMFSGFDFDKDVVLKACLVLSDGEYKFKADSFNAQTMNIISENWDKIANALRLTVELVSHFGYNKKLLTSNFSIIPIAYFIYHNNYTKDNVFNTNQEIQEKWLDNYNKIKEWLSRSLLKGVFGGHADNVYAPLRRIIKPNEEALNTFPLQQIIDHYKINEPSKSILFSDDEIEALLNTKYASKDSHSILALLYNDYNTFFIAHQDHLHPKSKFTQANLRNIGIDENFDSIIKMRDYLPNIQILPPETNLEKSDKPLADWVQQEYGNENSKNEYFAKNFIPQGTSLELKYFRDFYNARKKEMRKKLKSILQDPVI